MQDWDNLEKWTALWEKAKEDGVFEDAPLPPVANPRDHAEALSEEFRCLKKNRDGGIKEVDAQYWESLHRLAGIDRYYDDELKEDAGVKAKVNDLANTPNPIPHHTHGKDQDLNVTPNWTDGSELQKLHDLKMKLHSMGDKLAAAVGGDGKKAAIAEKKLEALKKQIDELSDSLHPDYVSDDES